MAFNFSTAPLSRETLQDLPLEMRRQVLASIAETTRQDVLDRAQQGMTSYTWDMDDDRLFSMARDRKWFGSKLELYELTEALKALYPDCTIRTIREWVPVPQREAPPKQTLQTTIRIEWE